MSASPLNSSINKYTAVLWMVTAYVFIFTLWISPFYVSGDQTSYVKAYNGVSNLDLVEGYLFYSLTLSSFEIVPFFFTWIASSLGLDKSLFMAISNATLAFLAIKLCKKLEVSLFVASIIVMTNFYLFVMYFAGDRLKFGFLFFIFSMLLLERSKTFYSVAVVAVFSHFQMLLMYLSLSFYSLVTGIYNLFISGRFSYRKLWFMVLLIPIAFALEPIYTKLISYSQNSTEKSLFTFVNISLFLLLSLWYSKEKLRVAFIFIPLIFAISVVGAERINLIGYFVFLYYGLQCKRGLNVGVLVTTLYFAIKSYDFTINIIQHGDGFAGL
jgi:hypothetical protein